MFMHEVESTYPFSDSEIAAMQRVKDQLASGERSEDIPGYRPNKKNLPILSGVRIFLQEPRWFGEPAEEPYDPKERIADLVKKLDEKILSNPKNRVSGAFENCKVTTRAEDGRYLSIERNRLEKVAIKVKKILHTFEDGPIEYPYYESEEFYLHESGSFSRVYSERNSPHEGCREVPIVHFSDLSDTFSEAASESLTYFSKLVAPFLATEG